MASSRARSCGMDASPRCVSTAVSPWPGKCFSVANHAARAQTVDEGRRHLADTLGILAERSGVDDRVARVVVHVGNGREVHMNANRPRLLGDDPARLLGQHRVARRAERHGPGKLRTAGDAHADAKLEIRRVEERHLRQRLQPVQRRRRGVRLPQRGAAVRRVQQHRRHWLARAEHQEAADVRRRHQRPEAIERIRVGRNERRLERRHQQLTHLLVNGERRHRLVDPATRGFVEGRIG